MGTASAEALGLGDTSVRPGGSGRRPSPDRLVPSAGFAGRVASGVGALSFLVFAGLLLWNVGEAYRIQGWKLANRGPYEVVTHFHTWALLHMGLVALTVAAIAFALSLAHSLAGSASGRSGRPVMEVVASFAALGFGAGALLLAPVEWAVSPTYWIGTPFDSLIAYPWGSAGVSACLSFTAAGACFLAIRASTRARQ